MRNDAQAEASVWLRVHGRTEVSHVQYHMGLYCTLYSLNNSCAWFSHRDARLLTGPCPPQSLWGIENRSLQGNNLICFGGFLNTHIWNANTAGKGTVTRLEGSCEERDARRKGAQTACLFWTEAFGHNPIREMNLEQYSPPSTAFKSGILKVRAHAVDRTDRFSAYNRPVT